VIVAGFLPIYALTGPAAKLFRPMADTTIYALLRLSRADELTLIAPCSVAWAPSPRAYASARTGPSSWFAEQYTMRAGLVFGPTFGPRFVRVTRTAARRNDRPRRWTRGRRIHAEARRRIALGSGHDAIHDLVRGIVAHRPQVRAILQSFPK
jgi:hypothetical protein